MRRLSVELVVALMVATMAIVLAAPPTDARSALATGPDEQSASYRQTIRTAHRELNRYWTRTFSSLYPAAGRFEPLAKSRLVAARPSAALPGCDAELTYEQLAGTTLYCPSADLLVYDDAGLFPDLVASSNPLALVLVLAHGWGHLVQNRAGLETEAPFVRELQADCFAGAYMRSVHRGQSAMPRLRGGELDAALAAWLRVRDRVGTVSDDPAAHGSAFDRASAFEDGFDHGASVCETYLDTPPQTTAIPSFVSPEDAARGGNLPEAQVLPVGVDILNDFYSKVLPDVYRPLALEQVRPFDPGDETSIPACGENTPAADAVRGRAVYCPDGFIAYDAVYLRHVYADIGDMGVLTVLGGAWGAYVRSLQGLADAERRTVNALLGPDCYTGAFAAAMANNELETELLTSQPATIRLSPGDLDETVTAFLDAGRARGLGTTVVEAFERFAAFRQGFFEGLESCDAYSGPSQRRERDDNPFL